MLTDNSTDVQKCTSVYIYMTLPCYLANYMKLTTALDRTKSTPGKKKK